MITGQRDKGLACIMCRPPCPPLTPNVSLAVQRLGTFAFVGLVEEWALSVCLLHTMHGPTFHSERCYAAEFGNSRKAGQYVLYVGICVGQPDRKCSLAHAHAHAHMHNYYMLHVLCTCTCTSASCTNSIATRTPPRKRTSLRSAPMTPRTRRCTPRRSAGSGPTCNGTP